MGDFFGGLLALIIFLPVVAFMSKLVFVLTSYLFSLGWNGASAFLAWVF